MGKKSDLSQHHRDMLRQMDRRYRDQFRAQEKALKIANKRAAETRVAADAQSAEWRKAANEWRSAMTDRERTFVSRNELRGWIFGAVFFVGTCFSVFSWLFSHRPVL